MPPLPPELESSCDALYIYSCQQAGLSVQDLHTLSYAQDESEASQNPNGNGESKNKGTLPKTSDTTLATLPFALAVVAGAVLCAAPVARRRSKF